MDTQDGDISIGPGKLLGLFFMLVAICAVFFAIGYSLGKTSAREQALNDKNPLNASLSVPAVAGVGSSKPSAAVASTAESENAAQDDGAKDQKPDLTFYDAVKRTDPKPSAAPEAPAKMKPEKTADMTAVASSASIANTTLTTTAKVSSNSESKPVAVPAGNGTFVVQIAAVTREEDAAALAGALRKKNYSVFVVNNPSVHDKFYHVQVGPFATLQDAEAMKAKLTGEGYNPIVKRT